MEQFLDKTDWAITDKLHVLTGLRYNYDKKKIDYNRTTYGGLQTTNTALLALKKKVYSDQAFKVDVEDTNFSGNVTLAIKFQKKSTLLPLLLIVINQ
ncbi:hypothetical protein MG292_00445 [Flavobacterium keumense]|uniref:Uncharacterized protein n=1 Tax=Flavobacterium keumense TaxID=1306518 RepID=A0ABY8N5V1_9FLAO|nr:hypothetical protein [Flavobacterium keumense]WGK94731.1 hypothetical protein MG292_00445 [Flavobacterium keumense]